MKSVNFFLWTRFTSEVQEHISVVSQKLPTLTKINVRRFQYLKITNHTNTHQNTPHPKTNRELIKPKIDSAHTHTQRLTPKKKTRAHRTRTFFHLSEVRSSPAPVFRPLGKRPLPAAYFTPKKARGGHKQG